MKSDQKDLWIQAMQKELDIMHERGVWHLEKLPNNSTPVGSRWVYTVKRDEQGNIARYKARLVAQGFKQIKGESYDETFSPVVNFGVIRFFFTLLAVLKGWVNIQCDVTSAYLYAPLTERVFMSQPPGFTVPGKENFYCKLNRAIYGLHQSGRVWFYELHKILINMGFKKFESCNCVYIFNSEAILLLYVDDIVIFGKTHKIIDKVLKLLRDHFDLKVLGKTKRLLGVEFEEQDTTLVLHQQQYITEICDRFSKFKIPTCSLPISKGTVYSKTSCPTTEEEKAEMATFPYRSILGCLSFLANRTRPDISYSVNIFSQFQANPGIVHWNGLLKLLGYVSHTKHLGIKLTCTQPQLTMYSDADFAANRDDRTSVGGQIVMLGKAPVDWRTFKEKCISLSTMESEFVAMTEAAKNLVWFDRILDECKEYSIISNKFKSLLHVDNQSAIDFVKSPIENYRSKHIDVKLFFVRDLVYKEIFDLKFVRSKLNLSDAFTKPLAKNDLMSFIQTIFNV